ncbi:sulfurtransferase [Streptomyces sp. NPDC048504]|uniref:sulfurtransferase n=1 Tax=Streptomyces sp. NPDC048504 TaxID=3365559 RepID=UPI0037150A96
MNDFAQSRSSGIAPFSASQCAYGPIRARRPDRRPLRPRRAVPLRRAVPGGPRRRTGPAGRGEGSEVVSYDSGGGIWAARLWWILRAIGVPAAVLDGGLEGWEAAGRPLASGDDTDPVPTVRPATPVVRPDLWAGIEDVAAISRGERPGTLVCALPSGGYDGSAPTRYSRRGHIPASRSLPGRGLLDASGHVLPADELAARVGAVLDTDDSPVVLYCGGGISAAGAALALTLLGRTDVSVYDGSLEEWSKDPARPLELGDRGTRALRAG